MRKAEDEQGAPAGGFGEAVFAAQEEGGNEGGDVEDDLGNGDFVKGVDGSAHGGFGRCGLMWMRWPVEEELYRWTTESSCACVC